MVKARKQLGTPRKRKKFMITMTPIPSICQNRRIRKASRYNSISHNIKMSLTHSYSISMITHFYK